MKLSTVITRSLEIYVMENFSNLEDFRIKNKNIQCTVFCKLRLLS